MVLRNPVRAILATVVVVMFLWACSSRAEPVPPSTEGTASPPLAPGETASPSLVSKTALRFSRSFVPADLEADEGYLGLTCVAMDPATGALYAGTDGLGIRKSLDEGRTWTSFTSLGHEAITSIAVRGSELYAVAGRSLLASVDGGATWRTSYADGSSLNEVVVLNGGVFLTTSHGILKWNDDTAEWKDDFGGRSLERYGAYSLAADGTDTWAGAYDGLYLLSGGEGWREVYPSYVEGGFRRVAVLDSCVLALGDIGIVASADRGKTWKTVAGGDVRVIDMTVSGTKLYACTTGGLWVSGDKGGTWKKIGPADGLADPVVRSVAVSGQSIYAVTAAGLSISADEGANWKSPSRKRPLSVETRVRALAATGSTIAAAGAPGVLFVSRDEGSAWRSLTSEDLGRAGVFKFLVSGPLICGIGGSVVSIDSGATWTTVRKLDSVSINDLALSGTSIYSAARDGISVSSDGGNHWNTATPIPAEPYMTHVRVSGTTVIAVAGGHSDDKIVVSNDGGTNWRTLPGTGGLRMKFVKALEISGSSWVVSTNEGLFRSVDQGVTWTLCTAADGLLDGGVDALETVGGWLVAASLKGISVSGDGGRTWRTSAAVRPTIDSFIRSHIPVGTWGSALYAVAPDGMWILENTGADWTRVLVKDGQKLSRVTAFAASGATGYAATQDGIAVSRDHGASWKIIEQPTPQDWNDVHGVALAGSIVYAGTSAGVMISSDGTHWKYSSAREGLVSSYVQKIVVAGQTVYALGSQGPSVSTDGGGTWRLLSLYGSELSGWVGDIAVSGSTVAAATPDGLYLSTDGGTHWSRASSSDGPPGYGAQAVAFLGSMLFVAYKDSVFTSSDAGSTWKTTQLPGARGIRGGAVSGSSIAWASSDGLWLSTDEGSSWKRYGKEEGLAADDVLAVALWPSAIFAATAAGLSVSTDGGATWKTSSTDQGLNNGIVNAVAVSDRGVVVGTEDGISFAALPP